MKLIKIEDDFITLLTKCAWWLDKNFNIGTVWFSILYILSSVIFLDILVAFNSLNQTENFNLFVISFLIDVVVDGIFFLLFLRINIFLSDVFGDNGSVLANTKLHPNPNKYRLWRLGCRYSCVLPLIFNVFGMTSFFSMVTMIFITSPSLYILCVDPMPPGLKKKMLEEKEFEKLKPIMSI